MINRLNSFQYFSECKPYNGIENNMNISELLHFQFLHNIINNQDDCLILNEESTFQENLKSNKIFRFKAITKQNNNQILINKLNILKSFILCK